MAPSFAAIQAAHAARVAVTPLVVSHALSARLGCTVALKREHLHPTGAFKYRGATNRIARLSPAERAAGIITASTGNHGLAAAMAGALADYLAAIART
jgi:threonine dehydratase